MKPLPVTVAIKGIYSTFLRFRNSRTFVFLCYWEGEHPNILVAAVGYDIAIHLTLPQTSVTNLDFVVRLMVLQLQHQAGRLYFETGNGSSEAPCKRTEAKVAKRNHTYGMMSIGTANRWLL